VRHAVLACRSPVRRSFFVWLPLRVSELFLDIGDEDFRKPDIKYLPPTEPRKGWVHSPESMERLPILPIWSADR
jgi:hypothetical protein